MLQFFARLLAVALDFCAVHWNDALTIGAFAISVLDLVLHIISHHRDSVQLSIEQTDSPAYSFSCVWYDPYDILYVQVSVYNYSLQPITLSEIRLIAPNRAKYSAAEYDIGDLLNDDGLTLFAPDGRTPVSYVNLKSENLLGMSRLEANDSKTGYLVFFGVPPVKRPTKFRVSVRAGKRHCRTAITVQPLPKSLRPRHTSSK